MKLVNNAYIKGVAWNITVPRYGNDTTKTEICFGVAPFRMRHSRIRTSNDNSHNRIAQSKSFFSFH